MEEFVNPLTKPLPFWRGMYKRLELFPWWINYNIGIAHEAQLKNKIIDIASDVGIEKKWLKKIIRHAISEFSKRGLGVDYYGYHNIDHELEATYFTMIAARTLLAEKKFSQEDIKYLFVAALFHDYDPFKRFDEPHEGSVELFLRNDDKVKKLIAEFDIKLDIVIALIYRTTYPFKGTSAEHAAKKMQELFTIAGISPLDHDTRNHYERLGWFLSVAERIAGYALDSFDHSIELARRNAHALGWHPSRINDESVKYFSKLKEEREMFEMVIKGIPGVYRKRYFDNVAIFKDLWTEETRIKSAIFKNEIVLVPVIEDGRKINKVALESILEIYDELPVPIRINKRHFKKSLKNKDTILITLRTNREDGDVVGFVKGGRLEIYPLRRGTVDLNRGMKNTAYMEWISIRPGYWGVQGGHVLRMEFIKEAKRRNFNFVSSYVHRNVIVERMRKGEKIEIVQKYDPDRLDYYRYSLEEIKSDTYDVKENELDEDSIVTG